jgi:hypothetical protein
MILELPHFFYFTQKVDVDFDSFKTFSANCENELDSNRFLLSLWREFDIALGRENKRCPWLYMPRRFNGKKQLITFLGVIDTTIGHFYVCVSYKKKGCIENIHFYSQNCDEDYHEKIKLLIRQAVENIDKLYLFHVRAKLISIIPDLKFHNYIGENFQFTNDKDGFNLVFKLNAVDSFEATQLTEKRLRALISFLAIETNIHFDYDDVHISDIVIQVPQDSIILLDEVILEKGSEIKGIDYIDGYPIKDSKVLLSKFAIDFIDKYIFVDREILNNKNVHEFLKGCIHFHKALSYEEQISPPALLTTEEYVLSLAPVGIFNKQGLINNAITFYLSSLEVISFEKATSTTCPECNQVQYKISQRVTDFVTEYLHDDLSKVFKKLYNFRSKFLHTGESSSANLNTHTRPMIDTSTATGAKDFGFVTVSINGNTTGMYTTNIKEWTSFCFRNYYRKEIMN